MTAAGGGSLLSQKSALRRRLLACRTAMGDAARRQASEIICRKIKQLPQYQQANCLAMFAPMAEEVDVWQLLEDSVQRNKTVALPRVADKNNRLLTFHRFQSRSTLHAGYKNIPEPPADEKIISLQSFDFLLVPAVAIDKSKKRLGYGGGFYDTVIINCRNTFSCTPIFNQQYVDILPCEKHDQSIHAVITEE